MDAAPALLPDLAQLALVIAHGTDADLDPRETTALVHQLSLLSGARGARYEEDELSALVEDAVARYGTLSVRDVDAVVARLGQALGKDARARFFGALVAIAESDGVVHTMESTVLRHIAQAWGIRGDRG